MSSSATYYITAATGVEDNNNYDNLGSIEGSVNCVRSSLDHNPAPDVEPESGSDPRYSTSALLDLNSESESGSDYSDSGSDSGSETDSSSWSDVDSDTGSGLGWGSESEIEVCDSGELGVESEDQYHPDYDSGYESQYSDFDSYSDSSSDSDSDSDLGTGVMGYYH